MSRKSRHKIVAQLGLGSFVAAALLAAASPGQTTEPAPATQPTAHVDHDIRPYFEEYCVKCHGPDKQKGDLRLDTLDANFVNPGVAGRWTDVMDRINSGEMPPKKAQRPEVAQSSAVTEWIAQQLTDAEAARQASLGEKVSFRRLSREEYRNTLKDLLGVTYDASDPAGLPADPDWQGFERIGTVLTLSPTHVEKYMSAAESVLSEAIATGPAPKVDNTWWPASMWRVGGGLTESLANRGLLDKVRADIVPNNGALDALDLDIHTAGEYLVKVKLSGLRPEHGRAPRLRLYAADIGRALYEGDVETAEEAPVVIEFRTHLPVGRHLIRIMNAVPGPNPEERASRPLNSKPFFTMAARQPWQIKLSDDDHKPAWPTLLIDYIDWQGPMQQSWPTPAHQQIFFRGESAAKDGGYAREILERFATRAYRRPATSDEVDRLMGLFDLSQKQGDNFETSIKTGLLGVLSSSNFIYLVEGSAEAPRSRLNDWELASRLSYFLWSTAPDQPLLDLAAQGKLHEPDALHGQVRRMLDDPRIAAFADAFPRQWLQLRRVGMFVPDRKLYPEYDDYLEKSMVLETTTFFGQVLKQNLGIDQFLDSNWTMLNGRLAEHYGIDGVDGEAMQRVALKPENHRGGLLTQGAILSLTSDGTRHRPVHRGKWILESIYGTPPPPPPPNVTAIQPAAVNAPKTTLRQKIEAHRSDANCAACHRKIDPLGLAFDNYDAVGHWRLTEAVREGTGDNPPLDPSGELPDGRKFADAAELKKLMISDAGKFDSAFIKKLATYALRRGMTFDDRKALADVTDRSKAQGCKLGNIIDNLVGSDLFQLR